MLMLFTGYILCSAAAITAIKSNAV